MAMQWTHRTAVVNGILIHYVTYGTNGVSL